MLLFVVRLSRFLSDDDDGKDQRSREFSVLAASWLVGSCLARLLALELGILGDRASAMTHSYHTRYSYMISICRADVYGIIAPV